MNFAEQQALIEAWTQTERLDILRALAAEAAGPQPLGETTAVLAITAGYTNAPIPSQGIAVVGATGYAPFRPTRMVILEPTVLVRDNDWKIDAIRALLAREHAAERSLEGRLERIAELRRLSRWQQFRQRAGRRIAVEETLARDAREARSAFNQARALVLGDGLGVPEARPAARGFWRIRGVFIGADVQFSDRGTISGDAFAPGEQGLAWEWSTLRPGIPISVNVENTAPYAAPFFALLIGNRLTDNGSASLT